MKLKKVKAFILIVLAGIAASLLIGIPAKKLGWHFLEQFSIVAPSTGVAYATGRYFYGAKRYTGFKEWTTFIAAILLVTAVFWALKEFVS